MGNTASNMNDAVKAQAEASGDRELYKLVDVKGGGLLVELTKQATATKNYAALDEAIQTRLPKFIYNNGEGKVLHISEIVLSRNRQSRPKHLQIFKNEKDYENYVPPDDKDPSMYKFVGWKLEERGTVGETCFLLCFLNATQVHNELAKRILRFFPKLINDVYESDEYYGENVLHVAIVNEDFPMVKYLLDVGVDVNQRCTGAFMSPEDQKATRTDNLKQLWVDRNLNTNYAGHAYWGEYPASFAACLEQEECYRTILSKGANPDAQDSNGNTVLHVLVIYNKSKMFNVAYELGSEVNLKNALNLTPLTLAAKLARREMFFHIMNIEREIYWQIGSVTCAAYPLTDMDTIDYTSGGIQKESALNLIVFGEKVEHLDLLEGPVIDLLHAKWNTFVKFRFYRQFVTFFIYFLISSFAFVTRPHITSKPLLLVSSTTTVPEIAIPNLSNNSSSSLMTGGTTSLPPTTTLPPVPIVSKSTIISNITNKSNISASSGTNLTKALNLTLALVASPLIQEEDVELQPQPHPLSFLFGCLGEPSTTIDWLRLLCECLMLLGAVSFILGAWRECRFLGASLFFQNLATVPSRVIFLFSCHMVIAMAVLRFLCVPEVEDLVAITIMMTTAPYFLFFCRGFKTVGPFVVMIYRMLSGDLLRFVAIYLIFVLGFSQAYFIVFLSSDKGTNPLGTPAESVVAMFMVSLSSFDTMYEKFKETDHELIAKSLFAIYMAIVAILLINMLIAMMGNTYTKIAETKNEWQRQWARIVLVVERGVHPRERLNSQRAYSQPMSDGERRALVLRLNQSEDEKEEMKDLMDLKRYHEKSINKRLNKMMTKRASSVPRPSIANSLLGMG